MSNQLEELRRSQDVRETAVKGLAATTPQPAQATQADVTDEQIIAAYLAWCKTNGTPESFARAILALRPAIQQAEAKTDEPVAMAWAEGYHQGIEDERISEANIGIAGFGAKVNPNRQNPYGHSRPAPGVSDGWKEATIAWEVCASIHRQWAKGKDAFFPTRQADYIKHAENSRAMFDAAMLTAAQAQKSTDPQDTYVNGLAQANNEQD